MSLSRRQVLQLGSLSGLTALAGCSDVRSKTATQTQTPFRTTTPEITEVPLPLEGRITGYHVPPSDINVKTEITLERPQITESATIRLRFDFRNTANREKTFGFGATPPFSEVHPVSQDEWLLLPPGEYQKRSRNCWEPSVSRDTGIVNPDVLEHRTLKAGEPISITKELWGNHQTPACNPEGEYFFLSRFATDDVGFRWGFSIQIDNVVG